MELRPATVHALRRERGAASVVEAARGRGQRGGARRRGAPIFEATRVGAVAIGVSGALYVGVNLEFPPLPINGDTVHAEQCAAALRSPAASKPWRRW